jgi:hypothetical protein
MNHIHSHYRFADQKHTAITLRNGADLSAGEIVFD